MIARLKWYLDPPSPHQLKKKKNIVKVGPPLTKLSGSAHVHGGDAQADLSLRWSNTHFVGFLMTWLASRYIV